MNEHERIEEGDVLLLDFSRTRSLSIGEADVVPAVIQRLGTLEVLMLAYMSAESLRMTFETGEVVLWSTTRQCLWHKGEQSGDRLVVRSVRVNCEQNSLLVLVETLGNGVCHTRVADQTRGTCYYREVIDGKLKCVAT